ncbi:hypothetical protein IR329_003733, partial [Salmonella enterica]|nr:hypothetical protein [Salmonella enterica]EGM3987501.1 hypothetical protein [Salmonella enterica]EGN0611833.1 hypothetical protein [Salmonella enterica]EIJ9844957.1 hypothetical protein [Salmonella enterica]
MNKYSFAISIFALLVSALSLFNAWRANKKAEFRSINLLRLEVLSTYHELESRLLTIKLRAESLISGNSEFYKENSKIDLEFKQEAETLGGLASKLLDEYRKTLCIDKNSVEKLPEKELIVMQRKLISCKHFLLLESESIVKAIEKLSDKVQRIK